MVTDIPEMLKVCYVNTDRLIAPVYFIPLTWLFLCGSADAKLEYVASFPPSSRDEQGCDYLCPPELILKLSGSQRLSGTSACGTGKKNAEPNPG